jgi:hypothetical protein
MTNARTLVALGASLVLVASACGAKVTVDSSSSGVGGAGVGGSTSSSATASVTGISAIASTGTGGCAPGTCVIGGFGGCQAPTGPQGNGCCQCGADGTCSAFCECAAPDTPVATPTGERAISSLREGDLVYSVDGARTVVVPIVATNQNAVGPEHRVVRVRLANGATLDVSGGHPALDGRSFAQLEQGTRLGGVEILDVESVPYGYDRTYDILAGSDSGGYFAGGALIGSTLKPAARVTP